MIGVGSFKIKGFDKKMLADLVEVFKVKLPLREEWLKFKGFGLKPANQSDATLLKLYTRDILFFNASQANISINTTKLTVEEDAIIQEILRGCNLVEKSPLLLPSILSAVHFILMISIILITANSRHTDDKIIMFCCATSFVFTSLGLILTPFSFKKGAVRVFCIICYFIGILTTLPSSMLQVSLISALNNRHLYNTLYPNENQEKYLE